MTDFVRVKVWKFSRNESRMLFSKAEVNKGFRPMSQ